MYHTLTTKLATLPDDLVLYPGHNYGGTPHAELGEVKRTNHYMRVPTIEQWRRFMG